jgi:BirA family biotin operon repressor/biotin-[acetyl-CoA-carboxylase] ligase
MPQNSKNIFHLPIVDSTNNYAMALIENKQATDELTIVTDEQSDGKGRHGNQWLSTKCENAMLSLILNMSWLPLKRQFELSAAISLAVCEFLERKTREKVFIKWPNDIFINDSKAAGILIENKIQGTLWQWAVVGVGCNINQVDFAGLNNISVTSLKKVTGDNYKMEEIIAEIRIALIEKVNALKQDQFLEILDDYNQRLYAKDEKVVFRKGGQELDMTIKSVTREGKLVVFDETERIYDFDEIKFLRKLS